MAGFNKSAWAMMGGVPFAGAAPLPGEPKFTPDAVLGEDQVPFYLANNDLMKEEPKKKDNIKTLLSITGPATPPSPTPAAANPVPQHRGYETTQEDKDLEKFHRQLLLDRQSRIGGLEGKIKAMGEAPSGIMGMDLTPLAGLVDSWTGSKLAGAYKGPQAKLEYDKNRQLLEAALDKERGGLTDDAAAALKMRADERSRRDMADAQREYKGMMMKMMDRRADQADERLALSTDRAAAGQYSAFDNHPIMKQFNQSEFQIARGLHTLQNPVDGIVDTKLLKELTNEIAGALQSGRSAVDDRKKTEYDNVSIRAAGIASWFQDLPEHIDSPELIQHVQGQLMRLQDGFRENKSMLADSIAKGRKFQTGKLNEAVANKAAAYKSSGSGHSSAPMAPAPASAPQAPSGAPMSYEEFVKSRRPNG